MNKLRERDRDRESDRQAEREREDCHLPTAVFHTEAGKTTSNDLLVCGPFPTAALLTLGLEVWMGGRGTYRLTIRANSSG